MPTLPSLPHGLQLELTDADAAVSAGVLDSLRYRIERLIHEELSATPPRKGRTARKESSTRVQLELFDDETGEMIFG